MAAQKENFVVSALKYRPLNWEEVVGQDAITDTLKNSIEQGQLAHAYLFCGPRGVGKTTCARIFAKEINRSEEHLDEEFSFNVFELDAASNNKVDEIRSLTDQVRIPPQIGKYKVYIIDEVHMLSTQAFNAFLKTLEEPPKHAIFILATTENHKIIPTILSRCQIYDFNRIPVDTIVSHLEVIAKKEKISVESEALHVIAQKADGALRDALSIFDQLSSFTNRNLTYEAVLKNLHVLDYDYYFRLVDFLKSADYSEALLLLDEILKLGFDAGHFINGLGAHVRDLLVCQNPKTVQLLEVADSVKKQYLQQAKSVEAQWLLATLKEIQHAEFKIRGSLNQRLLIEVAMLSIANLETEKKNAELSETVAPQPRIKEQNSSIKPVTADSTKVVSNITEPEDAPVETKPIKEVEAVFEPEFIQSKAEEPANFDTTKRKRRTSTISLNIDDPQPNKSVGDVIESTSEAEYSVERKSIEQALKSAYNQYQTEGKNAFCAILSRIDLSHIDDKKTIEVSLHHGVEEEEFSHHRSDYLQLIRSLTGDTQIQLTTNFTEQITETKLFTPRDKFEHLAKQNASLIKLRQDLDLDISY